MVSSQWPPDLTHRSHCLSHFPHTQMTNGRAQRIRRPRPEKQPYVFDLRKRWQTVASGATVSRVGEAILRE